ncbi:MAG: fibronectin type III domain-containing protein [Candidatus Sumerlaeaceae bacterium]|nr:fibronectin type III domain-containing protein [Candidatus Sumerlaeaceae bacterium]
MLTAGPTNDFRELTTGTPTVYRDLEETVPERLRRSSVGTTAVAVKRFVSAKELAGGTPGTQPQGSLTGKVIYASAGHGWTFETTSSQWYTQRPATFGLVEDYGNLDQMNLFVDYCFRAGATVVPMRPVGNQTVERILDNSSYSGVGFQGPWFDSSSDIFYGARRDKVPYRFALAGTEETAAARFTPAIPRSGYYPVYCWSRAGADRINQTYRIVHSGGVSEVAVNHRRVGNGWVYLGEYHFEQGRSGYVEITNLARDPADADGKHVVVADAVRFGNGLGDVNRGGGISGYPREAEASKYWVERSLAANAPPFYDASEASEQDNNVGVPPRNAAHMNRESDGNYFDRLFLSFHSNATGGRGCVGLFEKDAPMRPDLQKEWAELIAKQLNEDFTTTGCVELPLPWAVHPRLTDSHINFGEIRRDYINNEMVATILEVAFHDEPHDCAILRSPLARRAVARTALKSVLKFMNQYDPTHPSMTLLPEPPIALAVSTGDNDSVKVSWSAPATVPGGGSAPTGYRVYHSLNGYGFDGGMVVTTGTTVEVPGLDPGKAHYFKIAAFNAGGESLPSRTLGTARIGASSAQVLVVSAFSTYSEDVVVTQTATANLHGANKPGGDFVRIIPRLMNAGNYTVASGDALVDSGRGFDSATIEGLESKVLTLRDYQAVVFQFGRQAARDGVLTPELLTVVTDYLKTGGNIVLSGSNLVSALDGPTSASTDATRKFAAETLGIGHGGKAGDVLAARGDPAAFLSTATLALHDGSGGTYRAALLDSMVTKSAAVALLRYADSASSVAAVLNRPSGTKGIAISMGIPLETIQGNQTRADILGTIMNEFGIGSTAKVAPATLATGVKTPAPPRLARPTQRRATRR